MVLAQIGLMERVSAKRKVGHDDPDQLRRVFDALPAAIARWDCEQRCCFANHACRSWFGMSAESLPGKHMRDVLGALYAFSGPQIEAALQGQPQQFTCEIPDRHGGSPRLGLTNYVPDVRDGVVCGFFSSLSDVSDLRHSAAAQTEDLAARNRLVEQVRIAEARASGITEVSADAIICIDANQRISLFNDGAEKIFGYRRAEVLGAPLEILVPERHRAGHHQHVSEFQRHDRVARRMGERIASISGRRKNGEEFPADAAISKFIVGGEMVMTVSLRDVSEQQKNEHQERFLSELGHVLATTLGDAHTLVKVVELAACELADLCILELGEDEGQTRQVYSACRDPLHAQLCEQLRATAAGNQPPLLQDVFITRQIVCLQNLQADAAAPLTPNASRLREALGHEPWSLLAVPLVANARFVGAIALLSLRPQREIGPSEIGLAEELAHRTALAIESARLFRVAQRATQARDDILAIVAHDVRNPLASIVYQSRLLRRGGALSDDLVGKQCDAIERAAGRIDRLLEDLLDMARLQTGHLAIHCTRVSPGAVLNSVLQSQRPLATAREQQLELTLPRALPDVCADRDRLLQVLENLLGNASKFSKPGARITIGAEQREQDVLFWIADTGQGIATEDLTHLFDRFWQAKTPDRRGAGLGLAIVHGIIEAHRGRIWVESAEQRGSTFFFTIPVFSNDSEPDRRLLF